MATPRRGRSRMAGGGVDVFPVSDDEIPVIVSSDSESDGEGESASLLHGVPVEAMTSSSSASDSSVDSDGEPVPGWRRGFSPGTKELPGGYYLRPRRPPDNLVRSSKEKAAELWGSMTAHRNMRASAHQNHGNGEGGGHDQVEQGDQEREGQVGVIARSSGASRRVTTLNETKTKTSFWKLCTLLLCLLLVIFFLYLLWVKGDYLVDFTKTCVVFLKSCALVALSTIESVLTCSIGLFLAAEKAMIGKLRAQTVIVPVTPDPPSVKSERANVRESVAQIREPLPSVANVKLEEAIKNLQGQFSNIEQPHHEYEKRRNKHDVDISSLENEINQVIIAMKAVSMKEKSIEQILEEVLSAPIGETSDGTPVTLKSMNVLLKDAVDRERILLEVKFRSISEHIANVEQESRETKTHLDNMKIELSELNSRLHLMKSEVDEKWTESKEPEVDTGRLIEALLPVLKSEIEQKVAISYESRKCPDQSGIIGLGESDIELMIKRAIAKYDADKTGLPDLALEPAGGSVLSTRYSKSSDLSNAVLNDWGFCPGPSPITPGTILKPGVVPGECWAFEGSVGDVVIKLALPSVVTGFTLERIPKNLSRYKNIDSAPKDFQVLGLQSEHDTIEVHDYGTFTYEDNDEPLQYFPVANLTSKFYPIVELKIVSNQGNLKYTCIYRFRVHGSIDKEASSHGGGNIQNQNVIKDDFE